MSIFFSQIKEIFENQTKEKDFEKRGSHYRDKTFYFDKDQMNEENNCFISKNQAKNFELLEDFLKDEWFEEWKNNDYTYKNFIADNNDLTLIFNFLQNLVKFKQLNITEIYWINNWKEIIKNNKDIEYKNKNLEELIFSLVFIPKLKKNMKIKMTI